MSIQRGHKPPPRSTCHSSSPTSLQQQQLGSKDGTPCHCYSSNRNKQGEQTEWQQQEPGTESLGQVRLTNPTSHLSCSPAGFSSEHKTCFLHLCKKSEKESVDPVTHSHSVKKRQRESRHPKLYVSVVGMSTQQVQNPTGIAIQFEYTGNKCTSGLHMCTSTQRNHSIYLLREELLTQTIQNGFGQNHLM